MASREPMPKTIPAPIREDALKEAFASCKRRIEAVRSEAMSILHELEAVRAEQADYAKRSNELLGDDLPDVDAPAPAKKGAAK